MLSELTEHARCTGLTPCTTTFFKTFCYHDLIFNNVTQWLMFASVLMFDWFQKFEWSYSIYSILCFSFSFCFYLGAFFAFCFSTQARLHHACFLWFFFVHSYRKLSLKYHPEKNHDDQAAADRFMQVAEAYDVLSDRKCKWVICYTKSIECVCVCVCACAHACTCVCVCGVCM